MMPASYHGRHGAPERRTRRRAAWLALAAWLVAAPPAGAADYAIQKGDLLRIVVAEPLSLREEVRVDVDGRAAIPRVGTIEATGRSVAEIAAAIRDRLAARRLTMPGGDAGLPAQIALEDVTVSVAEYQPVYLGGQVGREGAYPYAPGLTARRAILLAGGESRFGLSGPGAKQRAAALETELQVLRESRGAILARIDRIRAGQAGRIPPDAAASELVAAEDQIAAIRTSRLTAAADHYRAEIAEIDNQIASLERQLAAETEATAADRADHDALVSARDQGTITAMRLSEARRALSYSASRQFDTASELARIRRERDGLGAQYQQILSEDSMSQASGLSEQIARLGEIDARMRGLAEELGLPTGLAPSHVTLSRADGTRLAVAAGEDAPLRPGDLVIVESAAPPTE